ncbi:MAG: hypothetical protein QM790_06585 [Nibricoccus sp.]
MSDNAFVPPQEQLGIDKKAIVRATPAIGFFFLMGFWSLRGQVWPELPKI